MIYLSLLAVVWGKITSNCKVCYEDIGKAITACKFVQEDNFLACFQGAYQSFVSPDCMAYAENEGEGCAEMLCVELDNAVPGLCPGRGIPPVQEDLGPCGSPKDGHLGDQAWIDCLNMNSGFKSSGRVGEYVSDYKNLLGVKIENQIMLPKKQAKQGFAIPDAFDVRNNWPQCKGVSGHVRDQSDCGSCWAHGTTEAFNDRMCIKQGGAFRELLSVSDTTGCCGFLSCFSMGCNGGQIGTPWSWFERTGVVSGGDYGDGVYCYDYTMPECAHHVNSTTLPDCSTIPEKTPSCESKCVSNTTINYSSDKVKASSSYGFDSVDAIKQDLVQYGSVTAAFTVYEDFVTYTSGIYKHTSGKALGGHAVKIIGYGTRDGQNFWIVVNSWNEYWGDQGLFLIAEGDCGIDSQCHAGLA